MDPKAHRRFLEYVEKHEYFGGGKKRLTRAQWARFDAERAPLEEAAASEAMTAVDLARLIQLRRLLLVD